MVRDGIYRVICLVHLLPSPENRSNFKSLCQKKKINNMYQDDTLKLGWVSYILQNCPHFKVHWLSRENYSHKVSAAHHACTEIFMRKYVRFSVAATCLLHRFIPFHGKHEEGEATRRSTKRKWRLGLGPGLLETWRNTHEQHKLADVWMLNWVFSLLLEKI